MKTLGYNCALVALIWAGMAAPAYAQTAAPGDTAAPEAAISDIIVTAQKRSERLNDVPMSITANTADQLKFAGVSSADDLAKVVPGFTYLKSALGLPIYFIRGIGFSDTTLGVSPAVTVYVDQAPLPFSPMSRGAALDLERVEVLKGPQGTLFGQNATGGAINYIAAKPTNTLQAGLDLSYGRFNSVNAEAFVSGPIANGLKFRIAARNEYQGDWQKSYVNNDTIGQKHFTNARAMLDWDVSSGVRVALSATVWQDTSDTQQPQFKLFRSPDFASGHLPVPFPLETYPIAPNDNRAASWDPGQDFSKNDKFYQFTGRADVDLNDDITLTSLTAYSHYTTDNPFDLDGTIYRASVQNVSGRIKSFSQELRLDGKLGSNLRWMLGGNYQDDDVAEKFLYAPLFTTTNNVGPFQYFGFGVNIDQKIKTSSVFGSVSYDLSDKFSLQGSVRYSSQKRDFVGCAVDDGDGDLAAAFTVLSSIFTGGPVDPIAPGGCVTLNENTGLPGLTVDRLKEDNVSWRAGANYKPNRDTLFYVNVTKGFKSGSFPAQPAPSSVYLKPIRQESVLAYEVGTKLDLFDRKVQLNAAAFYYDYRDKQLLGNLNFVPFGSLPALVSIPKSEVKGAEVNLVLRPVDGLTINVGGTYVDTKVKSDPNSPTGPFGNEGGTFVGQPFPFTPKWQGVLDAQYIFPVSSNLKAFIGGNVTARSSVTTALLSGGNAVSPVDGTRIADLEKLMVIGGYALLDVRAGIETSDSTLRLEFWGRNITNSYYATNVVRVSDYLFNYAGMPSTYGVTLRYRFGQ
jgi:outer membrane receptor protein involved in Fe transport